MRVDRRVQRADFGGRVPGDAVAPRRQPPVRGRREVGRTAVRRRYPRESDKEAVDAGGRKNHEHADDPQLASREEDAPPPAVGACLRVRNGNSSGWESPILARGGVVVEDSRVCRLAEGAPCRLTTGDGTTITARDVIVATHHPIFDRALLFARLVPHRELVVAAPVPADQYLDGAGREHPVDPHHPVHRRAAPAHHHRRVVHAGCARGTRYERSSSGRGDTWASRRSPAGEQHRTTTPPTGCPTPGRFTPAPGTPT